MSENFCKSIFRGCWYLVIIMSMRTAHGVGTMECAEMVAASLRFFAVLGASLPTDKTAPESVKFLLMSRDTARVASALLGATNHGCNKYNMTWLMYDLCSLVKNIRMPSRELGTHYAQAKARWFALYHMIEGGAALACCSCVGDDRASKKNFLLYQGLISLGRITEKFMEHRLDDKKMYAALALVMLNIMMLLGDAKVTPADLLATRPSKGKDLFNMFSGQIDDFSLGTDSARSYPPEEEIVAQTTHKPELVFSPDNGLQVTRIAVDGTRTEVVPSVAVQERLAPNKPFVLLTCNHILQDRESEAYLSVCPMCDHPRHGATNTDCLDDFFGGIIHYPQREWWGRMPSTAQGEVGIALQAYTQEAIDQLAQERGEQAVPAIQLVL